MVKKMVVPLLGAPGTKLTKTTLKQNLTNADIQFETLYQLYKRFKPDAIIPFMDLTVEADSLGMKLKFPENDNPAVKIHPIKTEEELKDMKKSYNGVDGRMNVFIDVVRKMAEELPDKVAKYAYAIGPFTLVGEMMGVTDASMATVTNPEIIKKLLDFSVDIISEYSNALFSAGADSVIILEPTAMLLSPKSYIENSLNPFKRILKNVDNKPIILHICGNTNHLIQGMCESGAVGLSLDSPMNFKELSEKVPKDMTLIGNVDPVSILLQGTPLEVEQYTRRFIKTMDGVHNFVLSTGCDLALETPLENIEAFMKIGREWKENKI